MIYQPVPLIADRVLVLNRGRVVEVGSVNEVMNNPKELYTKKLLDSILKVDT